MNKFFDGLFFMRLIQLKSVKVRAFTLLELMVVMSLVGFLTLVAIPSYQIYIERGHRSAAKADLTRLASALSEYRLKYFSGGFSGADKNEAVTGVLAQLKSEKFYEIQIFIDESGSSFQLSATPKKSSLLEGDGLLALNELGAGCWYKNEDKPEIIDVCPSKNIW